MRLGQRRVAELGSERSHRVEGAVPTPTSGSRSSGGRFSPAGCSQETRGEACRARPAAPGAVPLPGARGVIGRWQCTAQAGRQMRTRRSSRSLERERRAAQPALPQGAGVARPRAWTRCEPRRASWYSGLSTLRLHAGGPPRFGAAAACRRWRRAAPPPAEERAEQAAFRVRRRVRRIRSGRHCHRAAVRWGGPAAGGRRDAWHVLRLCQSTPAAGAVRHRYSGRRRLL